ncbi:MAG: type II toxin-antitoxin system PemK/MazF family toxin [Planctomycetota bacterium]|nr:MAG: type II toxin-antitoxin system PemK/MazF family toxin [Planctomycetota bacterium]
MEINRFSVWLVNLDPTIGSEIRKTRPAVIVSPDELNAHLHTVIVVPLTTGRDYPFRVATTLQGTQGLAAIDQLRTVDKQRLIKRLGVIKAPVSERILQALGAMFAP